MSRKTFELERLLEFVNNQLARTDADATEKFMEGVCSVWERISIDANRYEGYNNLYWLRQGCNEWEMAGRPETYPEKDKYIYGPTGNRYARKYY